MNELKIRKSSEIRVLALSRSLALIDQENIKIAQKKLEELGFVVTFGKNVYELDEFSSSSIQSRVEDLHQAFKDENVKIILTSIGGYNVNQILRYLDYNLIKWNPKVICGYSDITAILNAIYAKTQMVTYLGPHFSTFGMQKGNDYTIESFLATINQTQNIELKPSEFWSDDAWYLDQVNRNFQKNEGWITYNSGEASGTCLGGNIGTFRLLQGTEYMPTAKSIILLLEAVDLTTKEDFDRDLQSLIHTDFMKNVKGIIIGRFQAKSNITQENITKIINTKKELKNIPIITNVNVGHMTPLATFPIGKIVKISVEGGDGRIIICEKE
jgi:muramoyltetrapeptide carboxypeptidase